MGDLGALSQHGRPLYNIEVSKGGLITSAAAFRCATTREVIGAVGVSRQELADVC